MRISGYYVFGNVFTHVYPTHATVGLGILRKGKFRSAEFDMGTRWY